MKISAYKRVTGKSRVFVYRKEPVELPLMEILTKKYIGGEPFGQGHFLYANMIEKDEDENGYIPYRVRQRRHRHNRSMLIPLRSGNKVTPVDGIIGYTSEAALVNFINENLDLKYQCDLASMLRPHDKADRISKATISDRVYAMLNKENTFFVRLAREDRLGREIQYVEYNKGGSSYLIKKAHGAVGQRIFAWEVPQKIGGYDVPRSGCLYFGDVSSNPSESPDATLVAAVSNNQLRVFDGIASVNQSMLADADSRGEHFSATYVDLLPDSGLVVDAVLRVPGAKEFAAHKKQGRGPVETEHTRRVYYVEPSQKAAVIPDNTPVIDDIGVFERVASGISSGIYQPSNLVYEVKEKTLPEKEQFVLLMRAA
jgi:hypothetical protein